MARTLVLIYFARARLGHRIKVKFITFQTVDLEICSILVFFGMIFQVNTSRVIF